MKAIAPWPIALILVSFGGGVCPALANGKVSLEAPTPISMVEALRPEPQSVNHLDDIASQIQHQVTMADDPQARGVRPMPLLDSLMDAEGNLNLPLGIILYNTMGDPSIGFDAQF